jgi:hypothetical protein
MALSVLNREPTNMKYSKETHWSRVQQLLSRAPRRTKCDCPLSHTVRDYLAIANAHEFQGADILDSIGAKVLSTSQSAQTIML